MRTTRKVTWVVTATAFAVGLTGCSSAASPSLSNASRPTRVDTPAPSATAATPTTKAPEPGSVAVAGFKPARVASAARFAEKFALTAMSGCTPDSLPAVQSLMTPSLYQTAAKTPKVVILTFDASTVMAPGCVTSQKLTDGSVSPGDVVNGMPSVRVAVTVTEGLMVGSAASPKTLKPYTVTRRYTVDVLPSGTDWLAHAVTTSNTTTTEGK